MSFNGKAVLGTLNPFHSLSMSMEETAREREKKISVMKYVNDHHNHRSFEYIF